MSSIRQPLLNESMAVLSSQAENRPKYQKLRYFQKASVFSRLFFNWISQLMEYGNKKDLKQENLEDLRMQDKSELVYQEWVTIWAAEQASAHPNALRNSIRRTFIKRFLWSFFLDFFAYTFTILTPVMIYLISYYLLYGEKTTAMGFVWLAVVAGVRFLRSFFDGHASYCLTLLGCDVGNTLALGMVKKSLRYSVLCNKNFKMGQLSNLLQTDCFKLAQFPKNLSSVVYITYVLIFSIAFMGYLVHTAFLAGFGVIFMASVFNMLVSRRTAVYQKEISNSTDNRMKETNQIFNSIKFIKVNAWEEYFYDKIEKRRHEEVVWYKKKFMLQTLSTFSMWLTPKMILAATFGVFVFSEGELTAPIAFSVMSLFAYIQFYLQFLPNSLSVVIQSLNAIVRIQRFLNAEEINMSCITHSPYDISDSKDAITVSHGNFYWDRSADAPQSVVSAERALHLNDLNFTVKKNEMVAVIGGIGSGKSSMVYALLGQMKFPQAAQKPSVVINGKMSLVTQKPWIINDTVRNNILFGKEYNRKKYQEVIHYSSLKRDFQLFTNGDKTMIGEKGSTLSGGQKARISFARSLYSDSDILLLDDLLSAVDVHVGKFLMTESLIKYCKDRTRILVTHALYYLKYVDKILIMDNGCIVEQGSYEKLRSSPRFTAIYENMMQERKKSQNNINLLDQPAIEDAVTEMEEPLQPGPVEQPPPPQEKPEIEDFATKDRTVSLASISSHIDQAANKQQSTMKMEDSTINELMMTEQSPPGDASWRLYTSYYRFNGGMTWLILMSISLFGGAVFNTIFNIWLSLWTQSITDGAPQHDNNYFFTYYIILGIFYGLFSFFRALILAYSNPRMSLVIHESMMSNLLFSSLNQFFDRVPMGRILNRLSKDLNSIDSTLSVYFSNVMVFLFFLIGNTFVILYCTSIWVFFPICAYLFGCYLLKSYYMKPNRELARLEAISKSPIVSCFSEILTGVATIRSYKVENAFFLKNCQKIDQNKKPFIAKKAAEIWFIIRLTCLSFIINISALSIVLFRQNVDPSKASLLLAVSLAFDQLTYFYLTNLSCFQNELVSLERCEGFMNLPPERGYIDYLANRAVTKVNSAERRKLGHKGSIWPDKGEIKFIDFKVKYRPNLDLVLRGLNVVFQGGHKIGVVGRTGSGKSTIMMSLLRILEAYEGQIILDGRDIALLSLDDLRSKITIILQDPCLFAGTLRENLDPLNEYPDSQLLSALQKTAMLEQMQKRNGLRTQITQNGENLSVGERQLISIARAIIKPTKIVLVDEATANIDVETESIIYRAMTESFKNSTVITIAHRLNTVINSDRILVLEGGLLKEYNDPQILLKDPNSFFSQLYNESNKESKM